MKLAVLATLCAIALASSRIPSSSWEREHYPEFELKETVFRSGKEYQFIYNGQLTTGIPRSSKQHSATRIQAVVSLVFKQRNTVLLKILQARMGQLNRRLPNPQAMVPFMACQEVPIESEQMETLRAPVKFSYERGMISDVVFDGEEEPWSANIKRGIINMIQVNLHKHNPLNIADEVRLTNSVPKEVDPQMDYYTVKEATLEGECETHYSIANEPHPAFSSGPVLNVTKTINFEQCYKRPQIKYNWRFQERCPTCNPRFSEDQKFLKSSTVMRYNITGTPEEFCIESAVVESQYHFTPYKRSPISTYINQTLVLAKSGPVRSQIREPRNPQPSDSQLIYTLEWDIQAEKFQMEGSESVQESPFSQLPNKLRICESILRKIVREMSPEVKEEVPEQYIHLVKVMRTLKRSEIRQLHQKFMKGTPKNFTPEQIKRIRSLIPNALGDACTKDTVSHLVNDIIKKREVEPITAALSIKGLATCRLVSKEMIEEMETLLSSPVCQNNWFLKQAVCLTTGSMMYALCSPNEDELASESRHRPEHFCPQNLKQEFVQKMMRRFKSEQSHYERTLTLKTLSNAGLPESIFELEKIIKDPEHSPEIRTEAIMAYRQVLKIMPNQVRQILMPIFMNSRLPTPMRIAAVYQIFETLPPRPVLDQIASRLFRERRVQVATFVYSYMQTMANATQNPCLQKFSHDLQLSLRHGRKISRAFSSGYSKLLFGSLFSERYQHGVDLSYGFVAQQFSMIPKHASLSLHRSGLGFWSKYLLSIGMSTKDIESHIFDYLNQWTNSRHDEFLSRSPRSSRTSSPMNELKQLFKSLSLKNREMLEPQEAEGYFSLKWADQESSFIPFKLEEIKEYILANRESWEMQKINRWLQSGKSLHLHSASLLSEMSFKIPTSLGLPIKAVVYNAQVSQMTGMIKGQAQNDRFVLECEECKPSMSVSMITHVNCWNPVVLSGLKIKATGKLYVPLDAKIEMRKPSSKEVELKVIYTPPKSPVKPVTLLTRPVTFVSIKPITYEPYVNPQELTLPGEEYPRILVDEQYPAIQYAEEVISKFLGIQTDINFEWHHVPEIHLPEAPPCPLSGPNKFEIVCRPDSDTPKEIIFKNLIKVSTPNRKLKSAFSNFWGEKPKFQDQESWTAQMTTELKTKGASPDRSCKMEHTMRCSPEARYCRLQSELETSRIPEICSEYHICMNGQVLYPEIPKTIQEVAGKEVVTELRTTWGEKKCSNRNFLKIKVQGEQSPEHVSFMEDWSPEYKLYQSQRCQNKWECPPVQAYHTLLEAANMHQYRIKSEWQNLSPIVKNITNKIYHSLKTYYYWNSDVNQINIQNPEKQIEAVVRLDPRSKQMLNISLETPRERAEFMDLPLPVRVRPLNIRRKFSPYRLSEVFQETVSSGSALCKVHPRYVKTFDGVEYTVPWTNCWTLLAKDCVNSDEPRFAVLTKKISPDSQQKKVKIVTPSQIIEITPESEEYESLKVQVNGEQVSLSEIPEEITHQRQVVVRVEKEGPYVRVSLPQSSVRVYFDGYACNIKLPPWMQNRQCGLCGNYNQESSDEWMTPEQELSHDVRQFIRSYTLRESSCQWYPEPEQMCRDRQCSYQYPYFPQRHYQHSFELSSEQSQESQESQEQQWEELEPLEPVRRTKIIEQGNKVCFSKRPVPVCPHQTYPSAYDKKQKVIYCCLPRNDEQTSTLIRKIVRERQTPEEIKSLPTSFTEPEPVPTQCKRL